MNEKTELKIEGMHCTSCEKTIRDALCKVPGVIEAEVNFLGGEASVTIDESANRQQLVEAIASAGYKAHLITGLDDDAIHHGERNDGRLQLGIVILAAILTLPLLFQMVCDIFGLGVWVTPIAQFILATIIQFGLGWKFYSGSFFALKNLTGNMDLLVALGTTASWVYSTAALFLKLPVHLYFETGAIIITLVLLGRYLEARTHRSANSAITSMIKLKPKLAHKKVDGDWFEVPADELLIGDQFQVRPGEKIPVDGIILEGTTQIDESMLTGESAPVMKNAGEKVFAATQNLYGAITAKATATGKKTALARIIALVKEAQSAKAPVQRLVDKISAIFVPLVLVIALLTFFLHWGLGHDLSKALINAVAVLVIACPCALGMATPTVMMVATGIGAQKGILIRNGEAIQKAKNLEVLAIDKTGTLTEGKFQVTDIIPLASLAKEEILKIAASLEERSEHPIGQAIASSTKEREPVDKFEAIPGKGVKGEIQGKTYLIGSLRWMKESGIAMPSKANSLNQSTLVALADEHQILGLIGVADPLKSTAKEAVTRLENQGIEVVMLTGDRKETAEWIAQQAGIKTYEAEMLPAEKSAYIEKLKASHKVVGMVGDGVNDAAALAKSDISFAMRTGTDIAVDVSDITLMRNSLLALPQAISLSKETFKKVKQNLFFAFIYNIIGIPLAALGLLNPIIAGAAMAASSLCVVTNALLLKRRRI